MAYPTTAQEMYDRLLADREFMVRIIVNDNFPAVRDKFLEILQDNPALVNTPDKLTSELLWWNRNQGPDSIDTVIDVPYRNSANSAVLDAAHTMLHDKVERSGRDNGKFLAGGIAHLVDAAADLVNGQERIEAEERIAAQNATLNAQSAQQAAEQRAKLTKWAIGIGAVVVVVVVVLILKYAK